MKECKDEAILPCCSDDTHDKVYELNEQMCDLERGLSNDLLGVQMLIVDKLAKDVVEGARTPDWAKNMLAGIPEQLSRAKYEILDEILKEKNRFMEEKKTKKMTKAEAFEYLKGKKVKCYLGHNYVGKLLLTKIIECGFKSEITVPEGNEPFSWAFFMLRTGETMMLDLAFADTYRTYEYDEINAEELLSIKIVEDEPLDKWDEFARCVAKVQEKIEEDEVCIITKGNFLTMTK